MKLKYKEINPRELDNLCQTSGNKSHQVKVLNGLLHFLKVSKGETVSDHERHEAQFARKLSMFLTREKEPAAPYTIQENCLKDYLQRTKSLTLQKTFSPTFHCSPAVLGILKEQRRKALQYAKLSEFRD